jgi:hypothetical protein
MAKSIFENTLYAALLAMLISVLLLMSTWQPNVIALCDFDDTRFWSMEEWRMD